MELAAGGSSPQLPLKKIDRIEERRGTRSLRFASDLGDSRRYSGHGERCAYIYTEYKRGFPRFRFFRSASDFCVVLFTDKYCHLDPLHEHVVTGEEHQDEKEYSSEILDSVSADEIAALPLPRFAPFFKGFCHTYTGTQEATAARAAELLVDGMNIDEEWCQTHFKAAEGDEFNFALRLVEGKSSRIADFSSNQVACFVADDQKALRIRKIPGFRA